MAEQNQNNKKQRPPKDDDRIEIFELDELIEKRKAQETFPHGDGDEAPKKKGISIHLIIWLVILAMLAAAAIIFTLWNKGISAKVQEGEVTNSYSVEVSDDMVFLSASKLEGHEDDGETNILCLGNETFADDETDTGLAAQIAKLSGANVTQAAFPNSQIACLKRKYDPSEKYRDDIFNFFYVANSMNLGDYSAMETIASFHGDDDRYAKAIETLKNTDFDKLDMIVVFYDAADYINGSSMQNEQDGNDLTTYTNAMSNAYKLIQDKYPWIRIVFLSPYYINADNQDSRTKDIGNGTLVNYFQWAKDTCASSSVSFLDNYYGSVNEMNYKDMTTDGFHLNEDGRAKIADHFVYKMINNTYAEYDVGSMMVTGKN